jgi:8-oxo-dGTP pyrophosphatase MutT (NUDIX family)
MKVILQLKEEDVYPGREKSVYSFSRKAVRVVLFDKDNNVALGYIPAQGSKSEWYSMMGGGIDEGETVEEALIREALEETGCKMKNIQEIGIVEERGIGHKEWGKFFQENYYFTAEVDGDKGNPMFTEDDVKDGLQLVWLPIENAIDKLKSQGDGFIKRKTLFLLENAYEAKKG